MRLSLRSVIVAVILSFLMTSIDAVAPNTVVATIPVGITPDGLAITPDGLFAYVVNNNSYGLPNGDTVTVLNLLNNTVVTTIYSPTFQEPFRIAINAAGTKAYVCNSNACTVSIIDIASNAVTGVISGFDGPSGIVITPDDNFAYVNNYGAPCGVNSGNGTTVRVVDLNANAIVGPPIVVGQAPAALAITPDGAFVYVVNYVTGNPGTGTISVISTSSNTVVDTISGLFGPFSIAITPDGTRAYITNFGSNNFTPIGKTVSVLDLNTNTLFASINLAIQPAGIAITPDGRFAYATNYNTLYAGPNFTNLTPGQGTVEIIDIATNTVIPPIIAVDQSPNYVAIAPNGQFAYVTNFISNTVNVIALQSFQLAVQGCQMRDRFLTQEDVVNSLTITATGTALPVSYSIYYDAALTELVASVSATTNPLVFLDHNRNPAVVNTYYITGTNAFGITSDPVSVTVTQNC